MKTSIPFVAVNVIVLIMAIFISGCEEKKMKSQLTDFDKLWDYGDPAATRVKFEELLPEAEQNGDKSYHLQLLTQIARTYGLESNIDKAHKLLDQIEGQITDDLKVVKIRYLLERGRTFRSSGEPAKSPSLFAEAYEIAKSNREDFFAIDAAHMMALVAEGMDERMKWSNLALEIAEQSSDERARGWKGSLYNNIGWEYHGAKQFDKALEMFQKALDFRREQGKQRGIDIAEWCVARSLRSLDRTEEALDMQLELLRRHKEAGTKDGYVFEELGELYLLKGESELSRQYFASAYTELSRDKWMMNNESERMERIKKLGGVE